MLFGKSPNILFIMVTFLLIVVNAVAVVMWKSHWWVTTIVTVILVLQVASLHYMCKFMIELSNVSNPTSYLTLSFCNLTSFYG